MNILPKGYFDIKLVCRRQYLQVIVGAGLIGADVVGADLVGADVVGADAVGWDELFVRKV